MTVSIPSRSRPRHLALEELASTSHDLADGLGRIASWLERGGRIEQHHLQQPQRPLAVQGAQAQQNQGIAPRRRRRGRPSRAETISPEVLAAAPIPDLVLAPADRVGPVIRSVDDPELLRRAYAFECGHDARKTVIEGIKQRLRLLGEPLEE